MLQKGEHHLQRAEAVKVTGQWRSASQDLTYILRGKSSGMQPSLCTSILQGASQEHLQPEPHPHRFIPVQWLWGLWFRLSCTCAQYTSQVGGHREEKKKVMARICLKLLFLYRKCQLKMVSQAKEKRGLFPVPWAITSSPLRKTAAVLKESPEVLSREERLEPACPQMTALGALCRKRSAGTDTAILTTALF